MRYIKNKSLLYGIFFMLILLCIFQYGIQKIYGIIIYPDEFGYWASAANWLGYDWSELASMGFYYSYGYSLILTPILGLFDNGITAYRAAVAVNMGLMCLSVWLLFGSLRKLFLDLDETVLMFCAGTGVFYPAWIFYMQMTLTEALLMFLYLLIFYLFIRFIEKPKAITAVGLACSLIYIYFVHMRTVGVVIACVLTVIFVMRTRPEYRKPGAIFLIIMIGLGIAGMQIKEIVVWQVYGNADINKLAASDYSGQIEKFLQILTFTGLFQFLAGCISKLFYLGMSTFGLVFWAILYLVKNTWNLFKKAKVKKACDKMEIVLFFLLLSVTGQFLITAIYMFDGERIDCIMYGRYNELFVPIMMCIGLLTMLSKKNIFKGSLAICLISGIVVPFIICWIEKKELTSFHHYFTIGITYLYDKENFEVVSFFWKAYLIGCLLTLIVTICAWLCRRNQKYQIVLVGVIALEIFLGIYVSTKDVYYNNQIVLSDKSICDFIEEKSRQDTDIYYLYEGGNMYIDALQLIRKKKEIHLLNYDEWKEMRLSKNDFLITNIDSNYKKEWEENYTLCKESASFILYAN